MSAARTLSKICAAMLMVASCGGDSSAPDDAASDGGTDDEPALEVEENRSETYVEDLAVAEATVLTLDDLPVGWTSKPRDEDEDDDEFDQRFADCLGVPVEEVADSNNPKAESETFVSDDESEIEAEVIVSPTIADAADDFERVTSSEHLDCIREVLPELMEAAAEEEDGEFEIAEASIGPLRIEDSGQRSAAYRMTITVEVESLSVDVYFDIMFAQVGRATMQVSATSIFTTPDVSFTQSLLNTMVDRVDVVAVS